MFGKNCIVYLLVKKNLKLWLKQIWYLSIFRHTTTNLVFLFFKKIGLTSSWVPAENIFGEEWTPHAFLDLWGKHKF